MNNLKKIFSSYLCLLFIITSVALNTEAKMLGLGPNLRISDNNRIGNESSSYDKATNYNMEPLALLDWGPFLITDKGLEYNFYRSTAFALYLVGNLDGYEYESTGMEKRSKSIVFGGGVRFYPLSIFHMADLEENSNGGFTRAQLQAPIQLGSWFIVPTVGVSYYNQNWSQYYFGVETGEASSSRSSYSVGTSSDEFYNIRALWDLNKKWTLYFLAEKRVFSKEITSSPTVKDTDLLEGSIGLIYMLFK